VSRIATRRDDLERQRSDVDRQLLAARAAVVHHREEMHANREIARDLEDRLNEIELTLYDLAPEEDPNDSDR
jgi:hypothetical protein